MNRLGRFLADVRNQKALTQRAVEAATGISNAYMSQLESGKIREPSPNILHKLAELYAVPYEELLALAGYPTPNGRHSSERSRLTARLGPTTTEEEEALAEYLHFIRSRDRGRRSP